nr:NADH dehydrogenase subunit 1 [Saemundssonia lari]
MLDQVLQFSISSVACLIIPLLSVAIFSLFERQFLGLVHKRFGPNKVSEGGLAQPLSDAIKLLSKQEDKVGNSKGVLFYLSPSIMLFTSIIMWWCYPSSFGLSSWSLSSFFIILVFSITVYGVISLGWYSNSKYASLGAIRSSVQSISYEVGLAFGVISLCLTLGSVSISEWSCAQRYSWSVVWMPVFFCMMIAILTAESGRPPFDLPEGESELVGGFSVEYGGVGYTMVFLSETLMLLWSSSILSTAFLSSSFWGFGVMVMGMVLLRASVPRVRFDFMMELFWVRILPCLISLGTIYVILV